MDACIEFIRMTKADKDALKNEINQLMCKDHKVEEFIIRLSDRRDSHFFVAILKKVEGQYIMMHAYATKQKDNTWLLEFNKNKSGRTLYQNA